MERLWEIWNQHAECLKNDRYRHYKIGVNVLQSNKSLTKTTLHMIDNFHLQICFTFDNRIFWLRKDVFSLNNIVTVLHLTSLFPPFPISLVTISGWVLITSCMDYNSLQAGLALFHEKNRGSHLRHDYYGSGTGQSISYILSCWLLTAPLWDNYILLSASSTAETVEGQERENALPEITQLINDSAQLQTQASGAHAYCPVLGVEK